MSLSRLLAQEETFDWKDQDGKPRTYKLAPMSFEAIAAWEMWLKQRAWRNLESAKRWLSPEMFAEQSRIMQQDLAAGKYDFYSQVSVDAQTSWEGGQELIFIRAALANPDVDAVFLRAAIREMRENDLEKFAEVMRKMNEMDIDPNLTRPQAAGNEFPGNPVLPPSPENPGASDPGKSNA